MTVTLSAARTFDANPYFSAARGLELQGHTLEQASQDLSGVRTLAAEGWQGVAASAFSERSRTVENSGWRLSRSLIQHSQLLNWYAAAKELACKKAVSMADLAAAKGFIVSDVWLLSLSPLQLVGGNVAFDLVEMNILQVVINSHVSMIDLVDVEATSLLNGSEALNSVLLGANSAPHVTSNGYVVGKIPDRTINFDNDFPYNSKWLFTCVDLDSWNLWHLLLYLSKTTPGREDANDMYEHYLSGKGTDKNFDFEKGYREDMGVRREVDREMNESLTAANELVKEGHTSADFHSGVKSSADANYPETENWQKTVGSYFYYSDSELKVDGDTVTLTTTMTARDRWNFNKGARDIMSGAPDAVNGRFEELGWARSFDTSGTITRVYSWKVGEEPPYIDGHVIV
ncbi:hypothetical protein E4J66_13845 [Actinomyces viscosus]|uniref:Uncharacterized protein n=2 Tax=Actinomyces viscosus TaxID=1656 RepID=A0A448PP45_ACTVI|nr:hypothetical protein [Actinomyces viscosus]TFH50875.1 hypothetical protein E4J66_13845 [Actinomyces viscosus]VEI18342.1 Uncharacterised protein [Actinomyces viscosus]